MVRTSFASYSPSTGTLRWKCSDMLCPCSRHLVYCFVNSFVECSVIQSILQCYLIVDVRPSTSSSVLGVVVVVDRCLEASPLNDDDEETPGYIIRSTMILTYLDYGAGKTFGASRKICVLFPRTPLTHSLFIPTHSANTLRSHKTPPSHTVNEK